MKDVVIIGGGASGLMAAIMVKSKVQDQANVTILERLEKVGKKILVTGNGRCNFTNKHVSENRYNNPSFVKPILKQFNVAKTLEFFNSIGLLYKADEEGRYYPLSENASSVLDVLRNEAKRLGVVERVNFDVSRIAKENDCFTIESKNRLIQEADYVVVATGGKAVPVHGSNGSGFTLLKKHKMKITDCFPGLTGVIVDEAQIKGLSGLRMKAKIYLYPKKTSKKDKKEALWSDEGEVQFKENGLSGIVIMQLQSQIARKFSPKGVKVSLDLIPYMTEEELVEHLEQRLAHIGNEEVENFLTGMFHKMLSRNILKQRCKIQLDGYTKDLTKKDLNKIASAIKDFDFDVKAFYDFDRAQVTIGGLDVKEVVQETLEARKVSRLYVCGEVLNVDGDCGGFNLQWAWSSGYVVGNAIAKKIIDNV